MYCVKYRFETQKIYPFQNLSLTFILKSFLFLAGTRLRIGEKGEKKKRLGHGKQKKNKKKKIAEG